MSFLEAFFFSLYFNKDQSLKLREKNLSFLLSRDERLFSRTGRVFPVLWGHIRAVVHMHLSLSAALLLLPGCLAKALAVPCPHPATSKLETYGLWDRISLVSEDYGQRCIVQNHIFCPEWSSDYKDCI